MKQTNSTMKEEKELLRQFKITKQVQIRLFKPPINSHTILINKDRPWTSNWSQSKISNNDALQRCDFNNKKSSTSSAKPFHCSICEYSTATQKGLKQHVITHSPNKPFKCKECSHRTNNKFSLQAHVVRMHNKTPNGRERNFSCQHCSKSFYTVSDLKIHTTATHLKLKPFFCRFCERAFARKGDTQSHEIICERNPKKADKKWVEGQKRFKCNLCSIKMMTKSQLTSHTRTHTMERPFKCGQCEYAATSHARLREHTSRKHNQSRVKVIPCKLCPLMFYTKHELGRHISTHTKEKPWKCEFCNRQFAQSSERSVHYKICKLNPMQNDPNWVQKQKRFKCELCEFSAVSRYKIKRHLRTHTGEKTFKCALCKYMCSEAYMLNVHMRTHTREKPFKCPLCAYCGAASTAVVAHMKRRHC